MKIILLRGLDVKDRVISSKRTRRSGEAFSVGDMAMMIGKWEDTGDRG